MLEFDFFSMKHASMERYFLRIIMSYHRADLIEFTRHVESAKTFRVAQNACSPLPPYGVPSVWSQCGLWWQSTVLTLISESQGPMSSSSVFWVFPQRFKLVYKSGCIVHDSIFYMPLCFVLLASDPLSPKNYFMGKCGLFWLFLLKSNNQCRTELKLLAVFLQNSLVLFGS